MAEGHDGHQQGSVFISYSRRDKEFTRKLHDSLVEQGFEVWVDWEGIPLGTDWWQEIVEGIQQADNFVFVISPDSVASEVCADEIQTAVDNSKRLVPILYKEEKGTVGEVNPQLQAINFIFMKTDEEYEARLPGLIEVLNSDLGHIKQHTRIQRRALEWEEKGKKTSLLLRGDDLEIAEGWFAVGASKEPPPTELQGEYIQTSRQEATRRQRRTLITVSIVLVITIVLAVISVISFLGAEVARETAVAKEQQAQTAEADALDSFHAAETAQVNAENSEATAVVDRQIAEDERKVAETQQALAIEARATAVFNEKVADEQRGIAVVQKGIAEAQELASQAKASLPRGNLLTRSTLLAITSLQKYPTGNAEADEVLREALDLLPTRLSIYQNENKIVEIVFNSTGDIIIVGDDTGGIRLLNAETGEPTGIMMQHEGRITDMVLHPTEDWLGTASEDGTARIWDITTGEEIARFEHEGPVRAVAFSPTGIWFASGSDDRSASVWSTVTFVRAASVFHSEGVNDVAFSAGGATLGTVSEDGLAKLSDTLTGDEKFILQHRAPVDVIAFNPVDFTVLTASEDGIVQVWSVGTGDKLFQMSHKRAVHEAVYNADGTLIATASEDQTANIWDASTGRSIAVLNHDRRVTRVVFSSDGEYVATASDDDTARVWGAKTGDQLARMEHDKDVDAIAFSPRTLVLASGSEDNYVKTWTDFQQGQAIQSFRAPVGLGVLDFSPDESRLAIATDDRSVLILKVEASEVLLTIGLDSNALDVDYSTDGNFIATGEANGQACIWDAETGEEVRCFEHDAEVLDVDFSKDDVWLATGSVNGIASLWDIATGDRIHTYGSIGAVGEVSLSEDGARIAAASLDRIVRVWDIESESVLLQIDHPAGVFLVDFVKKQTEEWLITAARDNIIRVWNASTGKFVSEFFSDTDIRAIEISSDGAQLAIAAEDNITRVMSIDLETGTETEFARIVHDDEVKDVVFSSNGLEIATSSLDQFIVISSLESQALIEKACARLQRNLTQDEWVQFLDDGETSYALTCDNLPPGAGAVEELRRQVGQLGSENNRPAALEKLTLALSLNETLGYSSEDLAALAIDPTLLENAEDWLPFIIQESQIQRGRTDLQNGNYLEALTIYGEILAAAPTLASLRFAEFGAVLCQTGAGLIYDERQGAPTYPALLLICERALEVLPDNVFARDGRGQARAAQGDREGALEDLQYVVDQVRAGAYFDIADSFSFLQSREAWIASLESGANPFIR